MIRHISYLNLIFIICLCHHAVTQKCRTSDDNDGICIPVRECNLIVHQLARVNISEVLKQEIRELQCEYRNGSPYVCCDVNTLYPYRAIVESFASANAKVSSKLGNLLPTSDECGVDLSSGVYRIDDVSMHENPGLVVLKYENKQIGCGGTLINQRYVVTAASCVTGDIVQNLGKLKSVRLGEHDFANDPECDYSGVCKHYDETGVAETVVHIGIDLALIRLASDIDTVKYQPLCLSKSIDLKTDPLRVVGWGITSFGKPLTERKYLAMDYVNKTECDNNIERGGISSTPLPLHPICTKRQALFEKQVCPLDGGGVLMARTKIFKWTIAGLASYRPNCGDSSKQSLAYFTDVSKHLDWIQYNMRP